MGKKCKKLLALLLCLLTLNACAGNDPAANTGDDSARTDTAEPQVFTVSARIGDRQDTLDPALAVACGSETILLHLYENLMRWENDGSGYATLTYGQAESYTLETDYAGNATYSFFLREGIVWSNGEPVTARDFVAAWRRLADPAVNSPHRELLSAVAGYDQVQQTGDTSLLAISAPSDTTFMVTLNGSCAWFLEEVCAGAYTVPVEKNALEGVSWGGMTDETAAQVVTNGPYTLSAFDGERVELTASDSYYDRRGVGPEVLRFFPVQGDEEDRAAFAAGEIQLVRALPDAVAEGAGEENWLPEPLTATAAVVMNTLQPPFDDPTVRRAFALAVDGKAVADAVGDPALRPASGLVPYGVTDYGVRSSAREEEPAVLPDPNAAPVEEKPAPYWDFRIHSQELVTQTGTGDYAVACLQAQALMAQAGYAGGGGFPVVEYIYVESPENRAAALALQEMWKEQLGVTVTVRGLKQTEYDAMLQPAPAAEETDPAVVTAADYQLAGMTMSAQYSDAEAFLSRWHSGCEDNVARYVSGAFDILLDSAVASASFEARDAYLHDAEAILLGDAAVIPLYYHGSAFQVSDSLTGLYRAPDGVFFLSALKENAQPQS